MKIFQDLESCGGEGRRGEKRGEEGSM